MNAVERALNDINLAAQRAAEKVVWKKTDAAIKQYLREDFDLTDEVINRYLGTKIGRKRLRYHGGRVPLVAFADAPAWHKPVSIRIRGERFNFKHAFYAKIYTSEFNIYQRTGKERFPVKVLTHMSIVQMIDNDPNKVEEFKDIAAGENYDMLLQNLHRLR